MIKKDFSGLQKQDMDGGENKRIMKAGYIAYRTIQVAVLLYFAYELYMRVTTGRPISNLLIYFLLLTAPAKIYKNIEARNALKSNAEELKQHDKMFFRFLLLSIGIVAVLVIVTVLGIHILIVIQNQRARFEERTAFDYEKTVGYCYECLHSVCGYSSSVCTEFRQRCAARIGCQRNHENRFCEK